MCIVSNSDGTLQTQAPQGRAASEGNGLQERRMAPIQTEQAPAPAPSPFNGNGNGAQNGNGDGSPTNFNPPSVQSPNAQTTSGATHGNGDGSPAVTNPVAYGDDKGPNDLYTTNPTGITPVLTDPPDTAPETTPSTVTSAPTEAADVRGDIADIIGDSSRRNRNRTLLGPLGVPGGAQGATLLGGA